VVVARIVMNDGREVFNPLPFSTRSPLNDRISIALPLLAFELSCPSDRRFRDRYCFPWPCTLVAKFADGNKKRPTTVQPGFKFSRLCGLKTAVWSDRQTSALVR